MFIGIPLDINNKTEQDIDPLRYGHMVRRVGKYDNMLIWEPATENYIGIQSLRLDIAQIGFYKAHEIQHILDKSDLIW